MQYTVGIRIERSTNVYRVITNVQKLNSGDEVLLELGKERVIGHVAYVLRVDDEHDEKNDQKNDQNLFPGPITRVVRIMTYADQKAFARKKQSEKEAEKLCCDLICEQKLAMRLSRVSYHLNGGKAIFYFTAENRVDFRDLVRALGRTLHIRVEMRQIGVRDEAKLLGGLGPCGRMFCCQQHLSRFKPVSVRMAKNQGIPLNPYSISGVCSRLFCCLSYEDETYKILRQGMPGPGAHVVIRGGKKVIVKRVNLLQSMLHGILEGGEQVSFSLDELEAEAEVKEEKREEKAPSSSARQPDRKSEKKQNTPSPRKRSRKKRR